MGRHYYVYAYYDPRTGLPFYVGKGSGRRDKAHLYPSSLNRKCHLYSMIKSLLAAGCTPVVARVLDSLTESEAFAWEVGLIALLGRRVDGGLLCNHSTGGEGASGVTPSSETLAKRSVSLRGIKKSQQWRDRLSKSLRGRKCSDEQRRNMSIAQRGSKKPGVSEYAKNRVVSEATRRKLSEAARKQTWTDERRKRISDAKTKLPVESYDIVTGATLAQYESISAAGRAGYSVGNVHSVLVGSRKQHKGVGWRYSEK